MAKPSLIIDMSGPNGNIFMIVGQARLKLSGEQRGRFNAEIGLAMSLHSDKNFEDMLAIIDKYVSLEDSSCTYPDYSVHPEEKD